MSPRVKDMAGQRFSRLTVLRMIGLSDSGECRWSAVCDCGETTIASGRNLPRGLVKSCGCLRKETIVSRSLTHGEKPRKGMTREYSARKSMKARCTNNRKVRDYKYLAARGISVCTRWSNSYELFLYDMGRCPEGMTLDRKDNDKGYTPNHRRWATWSEQMSNRRYLGGST